MSDSPDSSHKPAAFLAPDLAVRPDASDFVEQPDVTAIPPQHEPLPKWLYVVCGIALFFAGSSFAGVDLSPGYYDVGMGAMAEANASGPAQPLAPLTPAEMGKTLYNGNCANCHQASGVGQPGQYPPIAGSEWVLGSKEMLSSILLDGVQGPLTVENSPFGANVMPQWANLSDEKIADITTYIRSSWGNKADAVTPAEVAAVRARHATRSTPWQQSDLEQMKSAK